MICFKQRLTQRARGFKVILEVEAEKKIPWKKQNGFKVVVDEEDNDGDDMMVDVDVDIDSEDEEAVIPKKRLKLE